MYYFQNFSDCNVECKHGKHKTASRARKLYSVVFSRNGPQILLVKKLLEPIRRPTLIWVVTRHQYGISALVSQTSFPAGNQWWRPEMSAVLPDYSCCFHYQYNNRHETEQRNWSSCVYDFY